MSSPPWADAGSFVDSCLIDVANGNCGFIDGPLERRLLKLLSFLFLF